jgi:hypothetical protein
MVWQHHLLLATTIAIGCGAASEPVLRDEPSRAPPIEVPVQAKCATAYCEREGLCDVVAGALSSFVAEHMGTSGRCMATSASQCQQSRVCSELGRCHLEHGMCVAKRQRDCVGAAVCQGTGCEILQGECIPTACYNCSGMRSGRCTLQDGRCVIAGNADCARADECKDRRACTAMRVPRGEVVCAYGDVCIPTRACKFNGACTHSRNSCVATNDEDCRQSGGCAEGRCHLVDGKCSATQAGCKASRSCEDEGRCTLKGDVCIATDAGCANSRACKTERRCRAVDGVCANPADKPNCTIPCEMYGLCTSRRGRCVATKPQHCQKSDACKSKGTCRPHEGRCVALTARDCAAVCKVFGTCHPVGGQCAKSKNAIVSGEIVVEPPHSDADCASTDGCERHGACSFAFQDCLVRSNSDCQQSRTCTGSANCTAFAGQCIATRTADCRASLLCKRDGRCNFVDGHCSALTNDDCTGSTQCAQTGRCTLRFGRCVTEKEALRSFTTVLP